MLSLGSMGVSYVLRVAMALADPAALRDGPVALAGGQQWMLIMGALFVVSSTIGFYSMVQDAQRLEIAERARRDPLTGLYNRRAFFDLAMALEKSDRPFSVLMADIDHFKSINDQHGHLAGDAVLAQAGQRVMASFRIDDMACRFGGEEFCVLLQHSPGLDPLARAQDLVQTFAQQPIRTLDGAELRVTLSVGVALHPPGSTLLRTIQQADQALYEATHAGRNRARLALAGSAGGAEAKDAIGSGASAAAAAVAAVPA